MYISLTGGPFNARVPRGDNVDDMPPIRDAMSDWFQERAGEVAWKSRVRGRHHDDGLPSHKSDGSFLPSGESRRITISNRAARGCTISSSLIA